MNAFASGTNAVYLDSVTVGDMRMADGQLIEGKGVTPDRLMLPTASDLANDRDPVLAYAAQQAGVSLTPEAAAQLFPRKPEVR